MAEEGFPPSGAAEEPAHAYTETPVAESIAEAPTVEVAARPAPAPVTAPPAAPDATDPAAVRGSPDGHGHGRRHGPPGAQVFLDERLVGTTPLSLGGVRTGTHGVRIVLPEHRRWATAVTVTGDSIVRVAASLER